MPALIDGIWFLLPGDRIMYRAGVAEVDVDCKTAIMKEAIGAGFYDPDVRELFALDLYKGEEYPELAGCFFISNKDDYETFLQQAALAGIKIERRGWTPSLIQTPGAKKIIKPGLLLPK